MAVVLWVWREREEGRGLQGGFEEMRCRWGGGRQDHPQLSPPFPHCPETPPSYIICEVTKGDKRAGSGGERGWRG